jgi:diketogulonate reductase-like aldo/keto reductase
MGLQGRNNGFRTSKEARNIERKATLWEGARHKPSFVQNRCFVETKWDKDLRNFCAEKAISYQGFSILTANSKFIGAEHLVVEGLSTPRLTFHKN